LALVDPAIPRSRNRAETPSDAALNRYLTLSNRLEAPVPLAATGHRKVHGRATLPIPGGSSSPRGYAVWSFVLATPGQARGPIATLACPTDPGRRPVRDRVDVALDRSGAVPGHDPDSRGGLPESGATSWDVFRSRRFRARIGGAYGRGSAIAAQDMQTSSPVTRSSSSTT